MCDAEKTTAVGTTRILACFLVFLFVFNGCGTAWAQGKNATEYVEAEVGEQFDEITTIQFPVLKDDTLVRAIQKLAESLMRASAKPLPPVKVVVLNDFTPNIFSCPNHIYLTTGLLDRLHSKDELAYLLSREIAYLADSAHYNFYQAEKSKKKAIVWTMHFLTFAAIVASAAVPMATAMSAVPTGLGTSMPSFNSLQFYLTKGATDLGWQIVSKVSDGVAKDAMTSHMDTLVAETVVDNQISALKRQSLLAYQKGETRAYQRLSREVQEMSSERARMVQELRRKNPRRAALWHPEPVSPDEVPAASGEYLLRYKVTDTAVLAWLVKDRRLIDMARLPVDRITLRQKVERYLTPFQRVRAYSQLEAYDPKLAKELYDLLMQPFMGQIAEAAHLIIVPDDILEALPFESLVVDLSDQARMVRGKFGPSPQGMQFVADRFKISYYYSATAMRLMRQPRTITPASQSLFVMADPLAITGSQSGTRSVLQETLKRLSGGSDWKNLQEQFRPLPEASELAEKLKTFFPDARILVGSEANKDNLAGIGQYKYLAFATHGILAKEVPYLEEPALFLYPEPSRGEEIRPRGFLTMSEVMRLNLACESAALTACSTGLGQRTSGEGAMSLGWAFQYAGAKSVLVSLWQVEEKSTTLLAEKFFQNLRAGKDKLTAFGEARAELRQLGYAHPFYWAPFIIIGEIS